VPGAVSLTGVNGNLVSAGSVTASGFFGRGEGLTGVTGTDATKVAKAGDTMTGALNLTGATSHIVAAASVRNRRGTFLRNTFQGSGQLNPVEALAQYNLTVALDAVAPGEQTRAGGPLRSRVTRASGGVPCRLSITS